MFRPGEVLILTRDVALLRDADRLAEYALSRPVGDARQPRDNVLEDLGIERWVTEGNVPDVVDALRMPLGEIVDPDTGEVHAHIPGVFPDHAAHLHYHDGWFHAFNRTPTGALTDLPRRRFPPLPGAGAWVGVLDTGISKPDRPWFDGRVESRGGPDEDGLSNPLDPVDGHGTHIAGIIRKFAPGARVRVRAVPNRHGAFVFDSDVAQALLELADTGVDVINCSFGGSTNDNAGAICMEAAIDRMRKRHPGLIVVASAGNTGVTDAHFPAAFKTVVGVGAVEPKPNRKPPYGRAEFSNYGSWVDAAAPGVAVHSTFVTSTNPAFHDWATLTGTSMAAPTVAAAIAKEFRPGGWRHYLRFLLRFLRPTTARQAAYRLINDPDRYFHPEVGTVIDPEPYARPE